MNELQTVTNLWNIVLGREAPRKWSEFHFKHNILKINSELSIYFDVRDVLFSMECNLFFHIPETYLGAYWSGLQTKYVHIDSIRNASNTFQWDLHRLRNFLIHQATVGSHIQNQAKQNEHILRKAYYVTGASRVHNSSFPSGNAHRWGLTWSYFISKLYTAICIKSILGTSFRFFCKKSASIVRVNRIA